MKASQPKNESKRLEALHRYRILDTPPDGAFDEIAGLAAELFQVPIAIVSLVDEDRIWFKARHGLDAQQIPRDPGLCASAILSLDVYHVRDAVADPRTLTNPLVAGKFGLRFYAAAPLRTHDGFNLGTLCILDRQPRDLSAAEQAMLRKLAAIVMEQMELRLSALKVAELEQSERKMAEQLSKANEALRNSEERFRDLFDEAPIAYVLEGLDSKFVRANRTAMRILGITSEQVEGTYGKDFVPDTPEAQDRLKQALTAISSGTGASGVLLELRRRDNAKPIFIQWWTRPDPASGLTRTMFVEITDRVQMEREKARLEAQNIYLQEEIRSQHNFVEIVGNSRALLHVLKQVDQVAPTDATVLLHGETGTGKELIARAIHDRSPRRERPLVKVNCGAISAGLVESELFGHVKGAFTGAIANRDGRFALADGGTIFLDEVGELPPDTQVKLLRVLQEQEFEPIGGSKTIKVDVRVIAATNRDLAAMVRDAKFRSDLYYRLNVFPVTMPPLRERVDDIPLLTMFFLEKSARKLGRPVTQVAEGTMARLCAYAWPGNIRELQNVIERAVVLATGPLLRLDESALPAVELRPAAHLPEPHREANKTPPTPPGARGGGASLEEVEREHITSVLTQSGWRIEGARGAAKILNLEPSTLRSRMKKLGIKRG